MWTRKHGLLSALIAFLIAFLVGRVALCQGNVNSVSGVPTYVLYHFFFNRVVFLQNQADHLKAQGLDDSQIRHLIQQQAGLTSQQESLLNAIALDWRANNGSLLAQIRTLVAAGQKGPSSPQLQALHALVRQTVLTHVGQLQAGLGGGSFYLLDLYVKRTSNISGPGVTTPGSSGH
jgi:hypothetical protein